MKAKILCTYIAFACVPFLFCGCEYSMHLRFFPSVIEIEMDKIAVDQPEDQAETEQAYKGIHVV